MAPSAPPTARRFLVRARHGDPHHARMVEDVSFESAAVAYVEDFDATPDADGAINIIVSDLESGHQHCFRVDLDSGETSACG